MRIVQAVWGVFHHFDLARELEQRGHLERVYSTFPWTRLKREGIARQKVETFPWVHMTQFAVGRFAPGWHWATENLASANIILFDKWLNGRIAHDGIDAMVALSSAGLNTGKRIQKEGGVFICDRGSAHHRVQMSLLREEFARWGIEAPFTRAAYAVSDHEEAMYDAADAITVPSDFAARSFVESGISKEKLHVIPYGVNLLKFKKIAEPPPDRFEALFVGSVGLRKGIPYLLEAFAKVSHPNKRLRVVGAMQPELATLLSSLPKDQVEFLGPRPQSELPEFMSRSHLMVLPSIEEGLALVQAQALACGCPVLASRNTGSEDLFEDGRQGFIVEARDPAALCDRMQMLADDRALQQRMSEAALRRMKQIGGWTEYGEKWVTLLKTLTER